MSAADIPCDDNFWEDVGSQRPRSPANWPLLKQASLIVKVFFPHTSALQMCSELKGCSSISKKPKLLFIYPPLLRGKKNTSEM